MNREAEAVRGADRDVGTTRGAGWGVGAMHGTS
jgi:hypothetical protein